MRTEAREADCEQAEDEVGEGDTELLSEVDVGVLERRDVDHEDGRHHAEHEDRQRRHVEDEQVKVFVVVEADAIVEPRAKMIHLEHDAAEHLAIVGAVGLVHVGLGLAADAPRAVVLHLERLQLRDELARLGVLRTDDP